MSNGVRSYEELVRENDELRRRLDEPEAVIRAISGGEVDAFVVRRSAEDEQVLVLAGVDRPYRLLIERMQQGAATVTRDGSVVYANGRLAELVGTTAAELIGASFVDLVEDVDRAAALALIECGSKADSQRELTLRGPERQFPALVSVSALEESEGVLCVIVTDLTRRKREEDERERLATKRPARESAERTSAALRAADRRKDEFLAMLAHELRNPLVPLQHGISILNLIGSKDPDRQRVRDMMGRQIDNLVRLIDDLLDLGRITQGKLTLRPANVDLGSLVEQAVEACRPPIEERRQSLRLTRARGTVAVRVDPTRVVQVVSNLLVNASKFTRRGGSIRVVVEQDSQATIRVADDGIGIAPEVLPRIFELFVQADPTGRGNESGLGIGLSLSRRLVELHGGSIEARSDGLGTGSEFIVRFPLCDAPPEQESPHAPRRKPRARRILVVDDNRDAAESMAELLSLRGNAVRMAHTGEAAFGVLTEFLPDVVLVDIDMPARDGCEVARMLRDKLAGHDVRFVALTSRAAEEDRLRSQAAGFDHHLAKPVALPEIEAILADAPRGDAS